MNSALIQLAIICDKLQISLPKSDLKEYIRIPLRILLLFKWVLSGAF